MTYQEILKSCGYPESVVVLDVETYADADYNLSKLTNYEYVTDPRFEVLGWAVRDGMKPAVFTDGFPIDWTTPHTVIMHNAYFDAPVLKEHYGIQPPHIIDTLDLARHVEARRKNSLAALATEYRLLAKGDTKQFFGLHRADMTAEKYDALTEYACNDAEITFRLFELLLPQLSNPRFELELAAYTRNAFLNPILCLNAGRAAKLKIEMQAEIDKTYGAISWIL